MCVCVCVSEESFHETGNNPTKTPESYLKNTKKCGICPDFLDFSVGMSGNMGKQGYIWSVPDTG